MDVMTLAAKLTLNTSEFDSGLTSSESKMKGISKGTVALGNLTAQVVASSARALKKWGKDAIDVSLGFDEKMSQVKAIAGASEEEFDQLRQKAMRIGETTKFTAQEAADALVYMGMAGWKTEKMLSGIDGVIALAAASGEDLGTVSDIVTDALTAFGMEADEAQHFANLLATTAMNANTNVGKMGQSFKYIAPVAGAFGTQAEDIAEALGLIANQGIKSTQAGTSLRRIFMNLATDLNGVTSDISSEFGVDFFTAEQSEEGRKAIENYNRFIEETRQKNEQLQAYIAETQDIVDAEGNVSKEYLDADGKVLEDYSEIIETILDTRAKLEEDFIKMNTDLSDERRALNYEVEKFVKISDFSEFVDQMREVWNATDEAGNALLSDADKATWSKAIAGQTGLTAWLALMNATEEEVLRLRGAIEETDEGTGAAQEMASVMLDNLQGDITILNSALDGLKLLISDQFKQDFRNFVQMLTTEVGKLGQAFKEGGLTNMITTFASDLIGGFADWISNNPEKVTQVIESIFEIIAGAIPKLIDGILEVLKDERVWIALGDMFKHIWQTIFGTPEANLNENLFGGFEKSQTNAVQEYIDAFNEMQRGINKQQEMWLNGQDNTQEYADLTRAIEEADKKVKELSKDAFAVTDKNGKNLWHSYQTWLSEHGGELEGGLLPDVPVELLPDDTAIIEELEAGYSATVALYPDTSNMPSRSGAPGFAKGLWSVPYDDFTANLHRGEMVLSASQARRYRDGNGTNLAGLEDRIEAAIRAGMENATVNSYINGRSVTDDVNRDQVRRLKSRRFAP